MVCSLSCPITANSLLGYICSNHNHNFCWNVYIKCHGEVLGRRPTCGFYRWICWHLDSSIGCSIRKTYIAIRNNRLCLISHYWHFQTVGMSLDRSKRKRRMGRNVWWCIGRFLCAPTTFGHKINLLLKKICLSKKKCFFAATDFATLPIWTANQGGTSFLYGIWIIQRTLVVIRRF